MEIQTGDIIVSSWGYDQTNVDAYQVIRTTPKMMVLQQIETEPSRPSSMSMCQYVVPVKDKFRTGARVFKVRIPTGTGFKLDYGWAKKHVPGKDYYESWYA